jgi:hypothetical protein
LIDTIRGRERIRGKGGEVFMHIGKYETEIYPLQKGLHNKDKHLV